MAEMPEIKITLDQEVIRAQVEAAVREVLEDTAGRLRAAADALDGGKWIREYEAWWENRVEQARKEATGD